MVSCYFVCVFFYSIKISVLLPLPANDCALLKLNINSLVVSSDMPTGTNTSTWSTQNGKSGGMYDFFLSKSLSVRGLSVSLNRVTKPQNQKDVATIAKSKTHDNLGVLLNPCSISSQVYGQKDKQSELHLHNLRTLAVHISASNIEWTPSCDQLFLIKDIFMNLEQESIKYQYQVIRVLLTKKTGGPKAIETASSAPSARSSISGSIAASERSTSSGRRKHHPSRKHVDQKVPFNPREVWVFAIRAILVMVKEKRAGGRFRPQLRSGMERLGLRRQYIGFYRRVLHARLYGDIVKNQETAERNDHAEEGRCSDSNAQQETDSNGNPNSAPASVLEVGLTAKESKRFAELHDLFSLSDLILFRATVLQEYKNKGVSAVELRHALTNSRVFSFWTAWFGKGANENTTSKAGNSTNDKSSSSGTAKNHSDEANNFTFDVSLSLARLSIAVFDNPLQPHHPNNRRRMSDAGHLNFATPITHRSAPVVPANGHNTAPVGRATAGDRRTTRCASNNYTAGMASRIAKNGSSLQTPVNVAGRSSVVGSAVPTTMTALETAMVLPKQCFAVVFYGIHTAVEWGGELDKMMNLSLGSFKSFGHRGAEIASCGGDPNYWLEYSYADAHAGRAPYNGDVTGLDTTKAVYFSLKWCQTAVMTPYELTVLKKQQREARRRNRRNRTSSGDASDEKELDNSDSDSQSSSDEEDGESVASTAAPRPRSRSLQRAADKYSAFDGDDSLSSRAFNSAYRSLMRASNKHLVVEVDVSFVQINWHRKSVLFLTDLYHHILPQSATGSSRTVFQHLKMQAAQLSYFRAAHGIVDIPAKVSIEAKAQGATIRVPIHAQRGTSSRYGTSGISGRRPLDRSASISDPAAVMNSDSIHYVELSFRKVTLYSGDYLTSEMNEIARQSQQSDRSRSKSSVPSDVPNSSQQFSLGGDAEVSNNGLSEYDPDISPEPPSVQPRYSIRGNRSSYTDYSRDRSNTSDPPQYEEETLPQLTPHEKIRELVLALQNAAVRPIAFCISHIELAIVGDESVPRVELTPVKGNNNKSPFSLHKIFSPPDNTTEEGPQIPELLSSNNRRVLTVVPWVVQGVISPNVIHNDVSFTQLRLDIICSAFQLQISTQVLYISF